MKGNKRLQNKYNCVISSPIGKLGIIIVDNCVSKVDFLLAKTPLVSPKNIIERRVVRKIKQYFCRPFSQINLPINVCGTLLQRKIWRALQKIPFGKTITYGELATKLKTGPRVIGNACRLNRLPIIIPCH